MLNCVVLMGRLVADPVLRVATTGREVCRFTIAIDRPTGDRVADFIPIICFGSSANFVEKYFRKGSMISVQGRLQTGSYTDDKGVKRNTFEVVANEVGFCGEKKAAGQSAPKEQRKPTDEGINGYYSTAVPSDFDEIVGDEEYE